MKKNITWWIFLCLVTVSEAEIVGTWTELESKALIVLHKDGSGQSSNKDKTITQKLSWKTVSQNKIKALLHDEKLPYKIIDNDGKSLIQYKVQMPKNQKPGYFLYDGDTITLKYWEEAGYRKKRKLNTIIFIKDDLNNLSTEILGRIYYAGNHTLLEEFKKRANNGDMNAMFFMARMFHIGHGVTADLSKAEKYYRIAVKGNHSLAMGNLAKLLDIKDPSNEEIDRLFKQAAKGKSKFAPVNYAIRICEKGKESLLNNAEKYVAMSIVRGDGDAGSLYANCLNKEHRNNVKRYIKWLTIGAVSKNKEMGKSLQQLEHQFFYELYDAYLYKKGGEDISKKEYNLAVQGAILWLKEHTIISTEEYKNFSLK